MNNEVKSINKTPIVLILLIGSFVAVLNQTLLATAIPPIMADLNIELSTAQWLTTAFMLVNGIMIPITAFLIGKYTTRQLFIGAMTLFALGTLVAALAPSFSILLVGRIIQASGAGIMMPLSQVVILTIYPIEKRGAAMGLVGLVVGLGPAIGPTLSGFMVEHFPWRSLFYIILPLVIVNITLAFFIMKNVTERTNPKIDIVSIVLSSIGFGGLLYGFSIAGNEGWLNIQVLISLAIGSLALLWFILRQFRLEQPILEFRVFKDPIFTLTTILSIIVFISMIGAEMLIPVFMQTMLNYSALDSGLALLPGAIVMGAMMPITGRIFDRYGARWLVITGFSIVTITTFLFTGFDTKTTFTYVLIIYMIRMFGISMIMMPVTTAGINQLVIKLIPHGTAMNNTMRQVGGSIGTAVLVTIMTNNLVRTSTGIPTPESAIGGVNTAFIFATILALIGTILAFFIRKTKPAEIRDSDHGEIKGAVKAYNQ